MHKISKRVHSRMKILEKRGNDEKDHKLGAFGCLGGGGRPAYLFESDVGRGRGEVHAASTGTW